MKSKDAIEKTIFLLEQLRPDGGSNEGRWLRSRLQDAQIEILRWVLKEEVRNMPIEQINEHCFVPPENKADECAYEACRMPECTHSWTIGARTANKSPGRA